MERERKRFQHGFAFFVICYVLTHFIQLAFETEFWENLLSFFGLAAFFCSLLYLRIKEIILPLFLMGFAFCIAVIDNHTLLTSVFWDGATTMRALISTLLIIPIVGWVLKQEDYVKDTVILFKNKLKNSQTLYFLLLWLTQVIGFFLNFGSIAVVYQIVESFFKKQNSESWQRFKSSAILRGFSFTTMWVISIPSFAYAVEVIGAPLSLALSQGFFVAVVGSMLSLILLRFYEVRRRISFSEDIQKAIQEALQKETNEKHWRNPLEFFVLFVTLVLFTTIANALFDASLLIVIPIAVFIWAVLFFAFKRRLPVFIHEGKKYVKDGVAAQAREISILYAASFLISALTSSGLSVTVMTRLYEWTEMIPGLNFLWILPLIVLLFGFFGLGPLTVMVLIAGIVKSIHLPYPPELIVLAMTLGSSLSVLISPLVIPVLFLSSVNGISPVQNSVKQNWLFAIGLYFIVQLYIQLRIGTF